MSTHAAEIVRLKAPEKHPNADSLELFRHLGWSTCSRIGEFKEGDLAIFIEPDTLVPVNRPEFAFLADKANREGFARIKAKKLRGELSFGLLVRADPAMGLSEGEDAFARLGLVHYEPPAHDEKTGDVLNLGAGENASAPPITLPGKYDLESFRKYHGAFQDGEMVQIVEKLCGENSRVTWWEGTLHVGSRTGWKKEFPTHEHVTVDNLVRRGCDPDKAREVVERVHSGAPKRNRWWEVVRKTPGLEKFCQDNPGTIVFGESFGCTQGKYKFSSEEPNRFAAFDIWRDGHFMDADEFREVMEKYGVPLAPLLSREPYSFERVCDFAEGFTTIEGAGKGVIREGCVVCPVKERTFGRGGRLKLKAVGCGYLEGKK